MDCYHSTWAGAAAALSQTEELPPIATGFDKLSLGWLRFGKLS